jgi:hypothetical protein
MGLSGYRKLSPALYNPHPTPPPRVKQLPQYAPFEDQMGHAVGVDAVAKWQKKLFVVSRKYSLLYFNIPRGYIYRYIRTYT